MYVLGPDPEQLHILGLDSQVLGLAIQVLDSITVNL